VAFREDRDMIITQVPNIALNPQAPMVPPAINSALTQSRRLVTQRSRPSKRAVIPRAQSRRCRRRACATGRRRCRYGAGGNVKSAVAFAVVRSTALDCVTKPTADASRVYRAALVG
jgi:hypothetical protein